MKALRGAAALRNLREQPLWRLMAADKAPVVLAILQGLLMDTEKTLPSSILHERLTRDLDQLRAAGEALPQTAQGYLADWLAQGWLTRRFPLEPAKRNTSSLQTQPARCVLSAAC